MEPYVLMNLIEVPDLSDTRFKLCWGLWRKSQGSAVLFKKYGRYGGENEPSVRPLRKLGCVLF